MTYVPRSVRHQGPDAQTDFAALHEGVPPWLTGSLIDWVRGVYASAQHGRWWPRRDRIRTLERQLRIQVASQDDVLWVNLELKLASEPELLLDAIDLALYMGASDWALSAEKIRAIESTLAEGGSAWRVTYHDGHLRLEQRVNETVSAAARQVMATSARAGEHLARAWTKVYGRDPSPSEGYREAVRAVEAAARGVVLPTDSVATLGKMIPALRDAPQKWRVSLNPSDGSDPNSAISV